ncbi:hypothetical protein HZA99_01160 [Candidatus Woesearchaeota archaeon]|nr:hypothetical protein [Candidatus Woesearchaeota archaeon]
MAVKGSKDKESDSLRFKKDARAEGSNKTTSLSVGNRAQRNRGKRGGY